MEFSYFLHWYNVSIHTVIAQKMVWEHIHYGSFLEKGLSEASFKCT